MQHQNSFMGIISRMAASLVVAVAVCSTAFAQQTSKVTGVVTDENGEPLMGAAVLLKGTTTGTTTGLDGDFSLSVPQGAVLTGDKSDIVLLDVTPLSMGIETMGGVMTRLIEANSTIPCKKSEIFSTAADNQTAVTIHVLQGERPMASQNKSVGQFNLDGIAPARRGVPQIEVTFDIDANGILNVSAKDKATGKEQHITITASSGLSKEEIERMKAEAEANAEADKKEREKVDKLNQADSMIFQTENMLKESGDKIPADVKSEVEAAVAKLKTAHQAQDLAAIDAAMNELQTAAGKMYQAQQQAGPQPGPDMNAGNTGSGNDQQGPDIQDADFEEVK